MPDALSKTIPIWCVVMNRLLFEEDAQNVGLYTPETVVSPSEHSHIESRLSVFVDEVKLLQLDLPLLRQTLRKPLRPYFLTPDLPFPTLPGHRSYHPIICLTSSHRVYGAENSENGYIQGAGDDSEGWSHGLTPALFWANKEALMKTNEAELPDLIRSLLQTESLETGSSATLVKPTECIYIGSLASVKPDEWGAIIQGQDSPPPLPPRETRLPRSPQPPPSDPTLHLLPPARLPVDENSLRMPNRHKPLSGRCTGGAVPDVQQRRPIRN
ncbi:MAG: hypothetical protein Q9181_005282 [Wetmoreana brouardii]